jgi:ureidoacrylate peracid hydrolase
MDAVGGEDKMSSMGTAERLVKIEAQPEQIEVDLAKTALVVVDMQNAFAGRGEDSNLPLQSIRRARRAIKRTKRLVEASRAATIKVVYLA